MRFRCGLLAILIAAGTAAAAQAGDERVSGTDVTSELLRPQPLDERPSLQAPVTGAESFAARPEYPVPLRAAPVVPMALVERPTGPAREIAVRSATAARVVPKPEARPARPQREATPAKRIARAAQAKPKRAKQQRSSAVRPLAILPAPARTNSVLGQERPIVGAFAQEQLPKIPWPFAPARTASRFDVPAGLW